MEPVFYIAHCPFDELSQNVLEVCVESIVKHHPNADILIFYSESNLPCNVKNTSDHISIFRSPIQNSSVIGAFKHYIDSGDTRKAVFLHDSMILRKNISSSVENLFGFLWYFDGEIYKGVNSIECKDVKDLLLEAMHKYPNVNYVGCFGCCLYSDHESILKLWNAFDMTYFVNHPQRAKALMDLERIIGFYSSALGLMSGEGNPVCGNIIGSPLAFNRWYTNQTLQEIESMNYDRPIMKAWMNRFLRE